MTSPSGTEAVPKLLGTRHVLAVKDLAVTKAFFLDALGMRQEFEAPGWAFPARGAWKVMLGECRNAMPACDTGDHSYLAYVTIDGIDGLYREYSIKGVQMTQPLANKSWGMREFGICTPDGHRVMFGQEIAR